MKKHWTDDFIGKHVTHRSVMRKFGSRIEEVDYRDVILLAVVGKDAMVRRPRAMAYVANVSELHDPSITPPGNI